MSRTTVDLKAEHRSALLALAARRGQNGFSVVLAELIDAYLHGEARREQQRNDLLSLAGSVSEEDAEELRATASALRESWR